ncbi:uncharacterized protein LOC105850492 [Hydra vulgaris]|uniref:uncharacterized protein LOC105850492 n=1 Tax=Hydra vulgaris TaxID=6087 RepID=UPI001F5FAEB5|nr:uncharacterized protein LOC105850492 isoform X2 [Hydra vulgaris]
MNSADRTLLDSLTATSSSAMNALVPSSTALGGKFKNIFIASFKKPVHICMYFRAIAIFIFYYTFYNLVPSISAIIVTSSAATSGFMGPKKSGVMFSDALKKV